MKNQNVKENLKKFWDFLWKDDSIWSTLALIAVSFIFIKFIAFPILGFFLGTQYPIVAVVSGSMDHDLDSSKGRLGEICGEIRKENIESYSGDIYDWWKLCGKWYSNKDISFEQFKEFPISKGFKKGDIIILRGKKTEDINIGDIIVFRANTPDPIIHRIVEIKEEEGKRYFQTKGDHNADINLNIREDKIESSRVLGVATFKVPWLGYFKIKAVEAYDFVMRR